MSVATHDFLTEPGLPSGNLSLEELAAHIHAAGMVYAGAKARFEKLDLFRHSVKALAMQTILAANGDSKISETRLVHMAEASREYLGHLERLAVARSEYEIARVHYEALRNLFEAKRSQLSYQKAELGLV